MTVTGIQQVRELLLENHKNFGPEGIPLFRVYQWIKKEKIYRYERNGVKALKSLDKQGFLKLNGYKVIIIQGEGSI